MIKIRDIKGAIFDLDGTLVDSMWIWREIDVDYLAKRGIEAPEGLMDDIGHLSFRQGALYFKKNFGIGCSIDDIMIEWDEMAYGYYSKDVKMKKGAKEYLEKLKDEGIKIGLATASKRKYIDAVLQNNKVLHYFHSIRTVDDVGIDKSSPSIYLKVSQDLGLEPKDCVVFEDIYVAVMSAKKAGMKVVGVYDEYAKSQMQDIKNNADLYIKDFTELI